MRLKNKIALITGGSGGLGTEMARQLAKDGADVILTYNSNKEGAQKTADLVKAEGRKAELIQFNATDSSAMDEFVSQMKECLQTNWNRSDFDFLLNNAGTGLHATIAETTEDGLDHMYNLHFKGVYLLTQKCLPIMKDGGRVVNVSSGLARFSFPGYAAYGAMKGAIEVFTRYLAKEVGSRGITANTIAPGAIDNDFNAERFEAMPQVKDAIASQTALGRVGKSEDVGGVVSFLCSDEAGWVNGQRIEISGGMFI